MVDLANYQRAIAWLRRGVLELKQNPQDSSAPLSILHRFEVTHNVTEAVLREAYFDLHVDEQTPYLSLRAQISRAREEGLIFPTPTRWLEYALTLESIKEAWLNTASFDLDALLLILPEYITELKAFAESIQRKLAPLG